MVKNESGMEARVNSVRWAWKGEIRGFHQDGKGRR